MLLLGALLLTGHDWASALTFVVVLPLALGVAMLYVLTRRIAKSDTTVGVCKQHALHQMTLGF